MQKTNIKPANEQYKQHTRKRERIRPEAEGYVRERNTLPGTRSVFRRPQKQGVGNMQKRGTGIALLAAAEEDVKSRGADGLVAWGIALPFWMKASWYKKQC